MVRFSMKESKQIKGLSTENTQNWVVDEGKTGGLSARNEDYSIFAANPKISIKMGMLVIIIVLFVSAIACVWVLPNNRVSKHEKDHV